MFPDLECPDGGPMEFCEACMTHPTLRDVVYAFAELGFAIAVGKITRHQMPLSDRTRSTITRAKVHHVDKH